MILENLTGWNEIGANSYVLDLDGARIVLDAGVHPKKEGQASLPEFFRLNDNSVDTVLISHAHLDHIGSLPVLLENQQSAQVYMTPATAALADAMLHNSVNVMQSKRIEEGLLDYPFFTHQQLDRLSGNWHGRFYDHPFKVGPRNQVTVTFHDAGHILGSAGIMLEAKGQRIFYTGDIQFDDQTVIPGAKFPQSGVDTLIIECTRGAFERDANYTREAEVARFGREIADALTQGGAVLIPVFAMGKTQEVLVMIHQFKEQGVLPANTPVYIGGLSTKVTHLFDEFASTTPRKQPGMRILHEVDVIVSSRKKRNAELVAQPGSLYVLSSGMMSEKTMSNRFARQIVENPKNSLFFVGYADPDSPAGHIKKLQPGEKFQLEQSGDKYKLNCAVKNFDFSGHADRNAILEYILKLAPKRTLLVHGDTDALAWMEYQLKKAAPAMQVIIPEPGKSYKLD